MKEYLLGEIDDIPSWVDLVNVWFELEEVKGFLEVGQGRALPAKNRPKIVGTWIQGGRARMTPTCEVGTLRTELLQWWKTLNPPWCQTGPTGEFLQSGEGDWGFLNASGRNGLLSVLACMNWWLELEEGLDEDPQWVSLLRDVQWVLESLLKETGEPPRKKSRSD
ncbi:hypothetical protein BT96DRAFT_839582 [Gymnopus androsaceus JB14]|uniref:Uncharacterized protein n=1 Tax=Gymnopus androsaceus JB14 TaxID=1447944 RepID=A0A6A4GKZ2_9AGAR|nr:hypothetical protein BT96DRAFT_839582 [Gymnopus androsaceus JB14]